MSLPSLPFTGLVGLRGRPRIAQKRRKLLHLQREKHICARSSVLDVSPGIRIENVEDDGDAGFDSARPSASGNEVMKYDLQYSQMFRFVFVGQ